MDSRGIKYEHENFWENLMTGEVDGDWADVEWVATIRKELQWEDENVFTKENDFSNNNTGFKDRLNAIEKKKDEVVDGNWDAVVVGDSTLKTDTPK
jgi:hypothetical protein